jgi:hypothetical protein
MDIAIFIFFSVSILMITIGYYLHDRDLFNPITSFVLTELVMMGLLSACSTWYVFNVFDVPETSLAHTVYIHLIYGLAVIFAYAYKRNPVRLVLSYFLQSFSIRPLSRVAKKSARWIVFLAGLLAWLMLVFSQPEGLLWVTSPRDAYINLRSGFGQYWLIFQACVSLLFIMLLYSSDFKGCLYFKYGLLTILFSGFMFFTGSKGAVLAIIITAFIYINFYVSRWKTWQLISCVAVTLSLFTFLLTMGSEDDRLKTVLIYFVDYVSVTSLVVDHVDLHGFMFGQASASSLWYLVPRSLFPDKPFEYGNASLHGVFFPGLAQQGHTPGVLSWVVSYMDLGLAGVILLGMFCGSATRAIYLEFFRTKDVGSFLLMASFCFFAPVASAPSFLFLIMALFLWVIYGKRGKCVTCGKN